MKRSVLVVDDERVFRVMAEEALRNEGLEVRSAPTLAKARTELAAATPDIILLDRRLPDGDGLDLLKTLRADGSPSASVIVITAYGEVENAVEALRAGASDYLTKPIQLPDLLVKINKAFEARGLRDQLQLARSNASHPPISEGTSPAVKRLYSGLRSVSQSPLTPVLVTGPSGAGKQCTAESLHRLTYSDRADAPFVEVNCAAVPKELFESELFGHEKGAFTDARNTRRGLVELADGGTLFLDELTELDEQSQAKLLKFLDSMRFRRVGSSRELEVSLRVVAATNQDLNALVQAGEFRLDLFHRLSVFSLEVPPLSERTEDIAGLVEGFVHYFGSRVRKRVSGISPGALQVLLTYSFPGNVRELRNIIERAVILATGPIIAERDLVLSSHASRTQTVASEPFFSVPMDVTTPPKLEDVERQYVKHVLEHVGGKRTLAAETLGISYPTLLRHLREGASET